MTDEEYLTAKREGQQEVVERILETLNRAEAAGLSERATLKWIRSLRHHFL